jgi:hypothetical protein
MKKSEMKYLAVRQVVPDGKQGAADKSGNRKLFVADLDAESFHGFHYDCCLSNLAFNIYRLL